MLIAKSPSSFRVRRPIVFKYVTTSHCCYENISEPCCTIFRYTLANTELQLLSKLYYVCFSLSKAMYNKRNSGKEVGQQHKGKIGVCFTHIYTLTISTVTVHITLQLLAKAREVIWRHRQSLLLSKHVTKHIPEI